MAAARRRDLCFFPLPNRAIAEELDWTVKLYNLFLFGPLREVMQTPDGRTRQLSRCPRDRTRTVCPGHSESTSTGLRFPTVHPGQGSRMHGPRLFLEPWPVHPGHGSRNCGLWTGVCCATSSWA
jgi:hypothetical protein